MTTQIQEVGQQEEHEVFLELRHTVSSFRACADRLFRADTAEQGKQIIEAFFPELLNRYVLLVHLAAQ